MVASISLLRWVLVLSVLAGPLTATCHASASRTPAGSLSSDPASSGETLHHPGGSRSLHDTQAQWLGQSGSASYYGLAHRGARTADGSRFEPTALTAAHPWLPFGTLVRVTLDGTNRSVVVTITDRLYSARRIVDLSLAAAQLLGIVRQGIARVTLAPA
jgi:rare lipoprotein A